MNKKIWLSSPHMGGTEEKYVKEAFDTNWIAPLGPNLDAFERAIEAHTGCGHAAALSSGTAAIHLALILAGVGPGDYVICQSFTFSASANPIRYLGAIPVFVDSEPETWNMCPQALEEAILACRDKGCCAGKPALPKAILPVHLYGMPAKMDKLCALAQSFEIPVIEDAAEAIGASLNGKSCGSFGDFGIFSFNGNKIITSSGGGALVSQNKEAVAKARFLATQARDPAPHYQHSEIGYNYRLSNVAAGIGRGQMEVLDLRVRQRRENFETYRSELGGIPGLRFLPEPDGTFSNRWLTTLLLDPEQNGGLGREHVRLALEKENMESRPLWKPMHRQPVFRDFPFFGSDCAEECFEKGLCLPSGSNLLARDLERIIETIKKTLKK
ncbi:DegT/DnrJ/EryC1/StrS family aminotransferase [Cyclobacterium sp. SYSU L10401]|uniref:DegT/DnrJ/EryC1/StrS family aminotransferase n=1 Tax=Cyclobacterium sp. SYSU L10401 TaxID=2678657 RepID=UPI0013D8CEE1|nr:DegT/DnrJ/EryC1/StrS family aminotransferase [Cyclobacterium sp. SYSU L10401]